MGADQGVDLDGLGDLPRVRLRARQGAQGGDQRLGGALGLQALQEAELAQRERDRLARVGVAHRHVHVGEEDADLVFGRQLRAAAAHQLGTPSMYIWASSPSGSSIASVSGNCCAVSRLMSWASPAGETDARGM